MVGYVLCISGKIGSGKSTIAQELCALSCITKRSTGEFLRTVAINRGIKEIDRNILQRIGSEFVNKGWDVFCNSFLQYCDWTPDQVLVIDGVRHLEFFEGIKRLIAPTKLFLVYIEINESERVKRIQQRDQGLLIVNENHETESHYEQLKKNADIIVQNNAEPKKVALDLLEHLSPNI